MDQNKSKEKRGRLGTWWFLAFLFFCRSRRWIIASSQPQPERPSMTHSNQSNPLTIIRRKQVQAQTGLSCTGLYDKLNFKSPRYDPTFPKQIRLGAGSVGWLESEVQAWIESRIRASREQHSPKQTNMAASSHIPTTKELSRTGYANRNTTYENKALPLCPHNSASEIQEDSS